MSWLPGLGILDTPKDQCFPPTRQSPPGPPCLVGVAARRKGARCGAARLIQHIEFLERQGGGYTTGLAAAVSGAAPQRGGAHRARPAFENMLAGVCRRERRCGRCGMVGQGRAGWRLGRRGR
jgi:hypothetical protein